ncbi:MAG: hypothetical protein NTW19_10930 [Planctomycetota bacterium]|nr:hypothetical protein [Planctomycetota bacterium]
MTVKVPPRPYKEWRRDPLDRPEDAAYAFGYHLIVECRDNAIETLPDNASAKMKAAVEEAVDTALHSLTAMLEGIYPLDAGPKHNIELVLAVKVSDSRGKVVETINIAPALLDMQIGYWKWAQDRNFRSRKPGGKSPKKPKK